MTSFCQSLVEQHEDILLACIIDGNDIPDLYVRPGVPFPDEWRSTELLSQTRLVMSIVLKGQDYMGKLRFIHFHMEGADGLHFSLGEGKILAVMLKPRPITDDVLKIIQKMKKMNYLE